MTSDVGYLEDMENQRTKDVMTRFMLAKPK